jgi:DnaJ-domain-containing protein 1
MTVRPLMRRKITELEELFAASRIDEKTLKELEGELRFRQVPRAVALLAAVRSVLNGARSSRSDGPKPMPKQEVSASRQSELWDAIPPSEPTQSPATPTLPKPVTISSGGAPTMAMEDAYKVLRATPNSTWDSIEQTRRTLVQRAHPDNVAGMSEDRRSAIRSEANRANAAYSVLRQSRVG